MMCSLAIYKDKLYLRLRNCVQYAMQAATDKLWYDWIVELFEYSCVDNSIKETDFGCLFDSLSFSVF